MKLSTLLIYLFALCFSCFIFFGDGVLFNPDFLIYKDFYSGIYNADGEIKDLGFTLLVDAAAFVGLPFVQFVYFLTFLSLFIKLYCISLLWRRDFAIFFLFSVFYFFTVFLIHEMIQIRVAFAISLFYVSLLFLDSDLKVRIPVFIFLSLVASQFHFSVSLLISISLLVSIFKSSYFPIFVYIALHFVFSPEVFSLLLDNSTIIDNEVIKRYLYQLVNGSEGGMYIFTSPSYLLTILFLLISFFCHKNIKFSVFESKIIYLSNNLLCISLLCFYALSAAPVVSYRMSELFRVIIPLVSAIFVYRCCSSGFAYVGFIVLLINLLFGYTYLNAFII